MMVLHKPFEEINGLLVDDRDMRLTADKMLVFNFFTQCSSSSFGFHQSSAFCYIYRMH